VKNGIIFGLVCSSCGFNWRLVTKDRQVGEREMRNAERRHQRQHRKAGAE